MNKETNITREEKLQRNFKRYRLSIIVIAIISIICSTIGAILTLITEDVSRDWLMVLWLGIIIRDSFILGLFKGLKNVTITKIERKEVNER